MLNSHADYLYKLMNIIRLLSLSTTGTAIVKRLGKKRQRQNRRFWIRPGRTSAWWNCFISEVVVSEEWRENFRMSRASIHRLADELRPHIEGKETIYPYTYGWDLNKQPELPVTTLNRASEIFLDDSAGASKLPCP